MLYHCLPNGFLLAALLCCCSNAKTEIGSELLFNAVFLHPALSANECACNRPQCLHACLLASYRKHLQVCLEGEYSSPTTFSSEWIFWTAVFDRSANNGTAAAVFGLTVDRCLVLLAGASYSTRNKRIVYYITVVVTLSGDVAICCELLPIPYNHDPGRAVSDLPEISQVTTLECRALGCTLLHTPVLFFYFRYIFGTLDLLGALWFAVLLHRYSRERIRQASTPSRLSKVSRHLRYSPGPTI